jgi:hypothetical protein
MCWALLQLPILIWQLTLSSKSTGFLGLKLMGLRGTSRSRLMGHFAPATHVSLHILGIIPEATQCRAWGMNPHSEDNIPFTMKLRSAFPPCWVCIAALIHPAAIQPIDALSIFYKGLGAKVWTSSMRDVEGEDLMKLLGCAGRIAQRSH